ncbi:unnamed protein product [Somion occarium]|uniref:Protein CPL1-like domain-containing protein n=1 Tax=Somion occarium TaxID=3059160 RepID=A0ABP1CMS2_9APHY
MALLSRLLLVALAIPFVLAHNGGDSSSKSDKDCSSGEFYFKDADCCVKRGGQPNPPAPPKDTQCPTNGWNWHSGKQCCVPHNPRDEQPAPQCAQGWNWDGQHLKCTPPTSPPKSTPPSIPPPSTPPPSTPTPSKPGNCDSGSFYFPKKDCCLPQGGQPNPPAPPKGTQCPPSGWSWHSGKGCCVPHSPPGQQPPPQCPKSWDWNDNDLKCYPTPPSTPTPPPSKPSSIPGKPGYGGHYKRHSKSRAVSLCPSGSEACPTKGLTGLSGDYECLDTAVELTSCGGCASTGAGQDCTAIKGAWNVGCDQGSCRVYTCAQGYRRSLDGKSCTKL